MAKKIYAQPFSRSKPATVKEAEVALDQAQTRYDEAVKLRNSYYCSGKPGKQRRDNAVANAHYALEKARAILADLQNQPSLF